MHDRRSTLVSISVIVTLCAALVFAIGSPLPMDFDQTPPPLEASSVMASGLVMERGTFYRSIVEDFEPQDSRELVQLLTDDGRSIELEFLTPQPDLQTGVRLEIAGEIISENRFRVYEVNVQANFGALSGGSLLGERRVLVFRLNYRNEQAACSAAEINNNLWEGNFNVNSYYNYVSAGSILFPPDSNGDSAPDIIDVAMKEDYGATCTFPPLSFARAEQEAIAAGFDINQYDTVMYVLPPSGSCSWAGQANYRCFERCSVALRACTPSIMIHELGHILGLFHSGHTTGTRFGLPDSTAGGNAREYGDLSCPMGFSGANNRHFNAVHKRTLGLINEAQTMEVQNGESSFSLIASDKTGFSSPPPSVGQHMLAKIPVNNTTDHYFVSLRSEAEPLNTEIPVVFRGKLSIHRASKPSSAFAVTTLVDILAPGQTFQDGNGAQVDFEGIEAGAARVRTVVQVSTATPTPTPTATPTFSGSFLAGLCSDRIGKDKFLIRNGSWATRVIYYSSPGSTTSNLLIFGPGEEKILYTDVTDKPPTTLRASISGGEGITAEVSPVGMCATPSPTPTSTPTITPTPTPSATMTPTPSATMTPTPSATFTPTRSATMTPTSRPSATSTRTPIPTPTSKWTSAATPTAIRRPAVDLCPSSEKLESGICGCDLADTDRNRNSVADCLEANASSKPVAPTLTRSASGRVIVRMRGAKGVTYLITVLKGREVKYQFSTRESVLRMKLPKGKWRVKYRLKSKRTHSKFSATMEIRV